MSLASVDQTFRNWSTVKDAFVLGNLFVIGMKI